MRVHSRNLSVLAVLLIFGALTAFCRPRSSSQSPARINVPTPPVAVTVTPEKKPVTNPAPIEPDEDETPHPFADGDKVPAVLEPSENTWPMYRGGTTFAGVSSVAIPEKPELLWSFKTEDMIRGSAAISGGRVFFGSDDGNLYCLSLGDGKKIWEYKAEAPVGATPCVAGKNVYCGSMDGKLFALKAKTGKVVWTCDLEGQIRSSPNLLDGKLIIGLYDGRIHCVDATTGTKSWSFETSNYVYSAPAISNNTAVFGGCDATLHALDLKSGEETSSLGVGAPIAASPAFVDGVAYFGLGYQASQFFAADVKTSSIKWKFESGQPGEFCSTPAVTKDKVVVGARDSSVHCLERATGKELWSFPTRGNVDSSPVVANDRIIVGSDDGRVYILSLADGKELWHYEVGSAVGGSAAVIEGTFVIGTADGVLYAFGKK